MKTALKIILPLVALAVLAVFLLRGAAPEAVVTPVHRDLALDAVSGNLRIFAAKTLILKTSQGGKVVSTIAPPNTGPVPVKAGDVVAQLDTATLERQLKLAQIRLDAAQERYDAGSPHDAAITNLEADVALQEKLTANEQFPEAELAKTSRALESTKLQRLIERNLQEEQLASLKYDVENLEDSLKSLTITSPFDGVIAEMYTLPGDLLAPGAAVARIISDENVVEVSLSEEDFAGIEPGQSVTVRLLSQGYALFDGKVKTLLVEADPISRRRNLYVELNAPAAALVPGTTGQASITKAQRADVLVIPRRALLGNSVMVVSGGTVHRREVETGFVGLNLAEIRSGLSEGELVIVETPHLFREGEEVQPVESGQ